MESKYENNDTEYFVSLLNHSDYVVRTRATCILVDFGGPKWQKRTTQVIDDTSFDKVIYSSTNVDFNSFKKATLDSIRALRLIRAFRINGHLIADLDPLKLYKKNYHAELDYKSYGFSENTIQNLFQK